MFKITRIYSDSEGESRFEEITMEGRDNGKLGILSDEIPAKGMIIRTVEPHYDYDFHNAPQRQFIILLDGEIEIETSIGEKRRFKGGDILLAEDTEGKGHRTKNIKHSPRKSVFITLGSDQGK